MRRAYHGSHIAKTTAAKVLACPVSDRGRNMQEKRPSSADEVLKLARTRVAGAHEYEYSPRSAACGLQEWFHPVPPEIWIDRQRVRVPDRQTPAPHLQTVKSCQFSARSACACYRSTPPLRH